MLQLRRTTNLGAAALLTALMATPAANGDTADSKVEPEHWAGVELAEAVSQSTGIAISPLLGVSSIGAWTWFRSSEAQRAGLP